MLMSSTTLREPLGAGIGKGLAWKEPGEEDWNGAGEQENPAAAWLEVLDKPAR